jgi:hypothetical protein
MLVAEREPQTLKCAAYFKGLTARLKSCLSQVSLPGICLAKEVFEPADGNGGKLLHRVDANAQARLVARGGIPVQRTLLNGFVEGRYCGAVGLLSGLLVAFFNGLAKGAQRGAQAGGIGAIGSRALYCLTGAL